MHAGREHVNIPDLGTDDGHPSDFVVCVLVLASVRARSDRPVPCPRGLSCCIVQALFEMLGLFALFASVAVPPGYHRNSTLLDHDFPLRKGVLGVCVQAGKSTFHRGSFSPLHQTVSLPLSGWLTAAWWVASTSRGADWTRVYCCTLTAFPAT